jgi:hypothetical protein
MIMKKITLFSLIFLGACATNGCYTIRDTIKREKCQKANKRFYDQSGWRFRHEVRFYGNGQQIHRI